MKRAHFIREVIFIVCSLILVLALLESSLRLIGFFYLKVRASEYPQSNKKGTFNIVCIGDSFTMGVGAAFGQDYPLQLEKILNARSKEINFRVINAGMGGCTTSMALNSLKGIISQYKPKIAIVMIGCNDNWNYTALNLSRVRGNLVPLIVRIDSVLSRFKSYKLIKIAFINLENTIKGNRRGVGFKPHAELANNSINSDRSGKEKEYLGLANEYYRQHELNTAINYYNKVLEINPVNATAYDNLAHIYRELGKFDKTVAYSKKILEMNSADSTLKHSAYLQLMALYQTQDKYDTDMEKILQKIKAYSYFDKIVKRAYKQEKGLKDKEFKEWIDKNESDTKARTGLFRIRENLINEITLFNLEEIVKIARDNNIRLIFCSYPESVTPYMEKISHQFGITFIDIRPVFKNILQLEERKRYFVPDNHCNANGYKVMAEVIAEKVWGENESDVN